MRLLDRVKPKKRYVWKSGSIIASASSRKRSNATSIEKEDFKMALPGVWHEQPADNGCEFVNRSSGEVLIVSILRAHEFAGLSELRPAIERLDAIRRNMIGTMSLGRAVLGPTQFRGTERDLEARFDGHDPQNGVRFSVVIRGCSLKVLTLSLYRDSLTELATPFAVYASLIFNLLKVKGESG
jgi:hypothetical protein